MNNSFLLHRVINLLPGGAGMLQRRHDARLREAGIGRHRQQFYQPDLIKGLGDFQRQSDISDHLNTLFALAVDARPRLIVELGTRGGESTRALLSAASLTGATMLSVDMDDCSRAEIHHPGQWHFMKADDIAFGQNDFTPWCTKHGLSPAIDVLFIDTSHEYEHTCRELAVWSPFLSEKGMMIFHDTNMGKGIYGRQDGSIGFGWDNQRGVIRAIEEFLGRKYSENDSFTDLAKGYLVTHHPHCNGLTILKKISLPQNKQAHA